ncbi:MAG: GNAT family N-acetyltransferase [Ignavibacteriae bacterium]|nr:GNAT family N-acetyltransferase [Ignavibacteriota bacterium]
MRRFMRLETLLFFSTRPDANPVHEDQASGQQFHMLDSENVFPWSSLSDDRLAACYRSRFRDGHAAIAQSDRGERVFTAWLASGGLHVDELGFEWRIPDAERVVYDCNTAPTHRGRGLYPAALRWIVRHIQRDDVSRVWIYADARNHASLRGIEKAGFDAAGLMRTYWLADIPVLRRGRVVGVNT